MRAKPASIHLTPLQNQNTKCLPCHCYDFPNFFPLFFLHRKIIQMATLRSDSSLILFLTIWPWPSDQTLMKVTQCSSTDHKLSGGMRFSYFLSPNFAPSLDSDPTTYFYIIRDMINMSCKNSTCLKCLSKRKKVERRQVCQNDRLGMGTNQM